MSRRWGASRRRKLAQQSAQRRRARRVAQSMSAKAAEVSVVTNEKER